MGSIALARHRLIRAYRFSLCSTGVVLLAPVLPPGVRVIVLPALFAGPVGLVVLGARRWVRGFSIKAAAMLVAPLGLALLILSMLGLYVAGIRFSSVSVSLAPALIGLGCALATERGALKTYLLGGGNSSHGSGA